MKEFIQKITKTQMRSTLAVVIVVGVFVLNTVLMYRNVPPANNDIVYMVMGMLMGCLVTVVSFYFGTSKNETDKQKAELKETK